MNVYVDASVLLRVILGEPGRVEIWSHVTVPISSQLILVECLRTVDRARVAIGLTDEQVAERRAAVLDAVERLTLVPLDHRVLDRAAQPFPTSLGTLDALHLASALLAADAVEGLGFATHDAELGMAARAMGFTVHGVPA